MPIGKSNSIALPESVEAQEGEQAEFMVTGTVEMVNGVPYLMVSEVEGEPVGKPVSDNEEMETPNQMRIKEIEGTLRKKARVNSGYSEE
jgi:hypothetical protein